MRILRQRAFPCVYFPTFITISAISARPVLHVHIRLILDLVDRDPTQIYELSNLSRRDSWRYSILGATGEIAL